MGFIKVISGFIRAQWEIIKALHVFKAVYELIKVRSEFIKVL
jgi:hypothetical protein